MTFADRLLAWLGGLALVALHVDFWRPRRPVLWLGWLPEELAYRLGWMLLAWLYLLFLTRRVWNRETAGAADEETREADG